MKITYSECLVVLWGGACHILQSQSGHSVPITNSYSHECCMWMKYLSWSGENVLFACTSLRPKTSGVGGLTCNPMWKDPLRIVHNSFRKKHDKLTSYYDILNRWHPPWGRSMGERTKIPCELAHSSIHYRITGWKLVVYGILSCVFAPKQYWDDLRW